MSHSLTERTEFSITESVLPGVIRSLLRLGLGYCEQLFDLFVSVLRLILGRQKTGELNEKPEPCVFSHGANTAINLIHSRKSTHNSSHTILSSLSALFRGVSLRRATG